MPNPSQKKYRAVVGVPCSAFQYLDVPLLRETYTNEHKTGNRTRSDGDDHRLQER